MEESCGDFKVLRFYTCFCACSVSQLCLAFCDPMDRFSRQEYWSGLLFPTPGDLPDPGTKPAFLLHLLHWQADSLPLSHLGRFYFCSRLVNMLLSLSSCVPTMILLPGVIQANRITSTSVQKQNKNVRFDPGIEGCKPMLYSRGPKHFWHQGLVCGR